MLRASSGKIGEIETSHGHLIKNLAIQLKKKLQNKNIWGIIKLLMDMY